MQIFGFQVDGSAVVCRFVPLSPLVSANKLLGLGSALGTTSRHTAAQADYLRTCPALLRSERRAATVKSIEMMPTFDED
ncbi:hypothetical protein J6590_032334 [Homalodisca vitripennis]|nr:hypothetical protein J6590_032334 [Homalodisca vitripennis]